MVQGSSRQYLFAYAGVEGRSNQLSNSTIFLVIFEEIVYDTAARCLPTKGDLSTGIISFVSRYEQDLAEGKCSNKEDMVILANLKNTGVVL